MRINHVTLLAAPILVFYSNLCIASPLSAGAAIQRIAPASVGDNPEPTCTSPDTLLTTHDGLGTFSNDCITAANEFFTMSTIAHIWHWERHRPGVDPPPGHKFLPFAVAPKSCMIQLDVLSDPDAEDEFALMTLTKPFRLIFNKCVRADSQGSTGGFVPVGPRQVLKLSVLPTPTGWVPGGFAVKYSSRLNMTTFLNAASES